MRRLLPAVAGAGIAVAVLLITASYGLASRTDGADPLENYYGNTLVCAAARTGNDLCHLWLNRDGTFINFDRSGGHAGRYRIGAVRPDGKVPVCQYWDTPNMIMPKELDKPLPVPAAGAGQQDWVLVCVTKNFRTSCRRADPAGLTAQERRIAARSMGERFQAGMCYPLGRHAVGDVWFESDDPLPGQLGKDKLLLVHGRR